MARLIFPLVGLALIILWAYTIATIVKTPDYRYRTGNQLVWLLVVILAAPVGVPLFYIMGAPESGS